MKTDMKTADSSSRNTAPPARAEHGIAAFVTGTDTEIGKTFIASALLARARLRGLTTLGLKPVASDCFENHDGLVNADALSLQAQCEPEADYESINPWRFAPAIAPHIAARQVGVNLEVAKIAAQVRGQQTSAPRDLLLVEGAGGWRVPLNDDEDFSDLAIELGLPVILVVGLRLGCINHARLTLEAIERDGLEIAGYVINHLEADIEVSEDNMATLSRTLRAPCLGVVPWMCDEDLSNTRHAAERAASYLQLPCGLESRSVHVVQE